ncbi:unnamed protein product [Adineta steineri]|uniref:EGF-like domain-containing protein n=1 Tax=Adineta steineri TaxID=433720 RepID=A0A813U5K9_9BILA|nr:unnamed protein product [Adineta steineri]CAF4054101.1 unnamed protein product [Adineta steineri]
MFNIPSIPVLFGDIYLAYEKNDSIKFADEEFPDPYICYNNLLYDDYFTDSEMLSFNGRKCYRFYISELSAKNYDDGTDECHCDASLVLCENECIRLNNDESTFICFCLCSYYGSRCEYQNQRVSLAIKFQAYSESRQTLFEIIIQLIDDSNERIVHSHVQFTYLFARDCETIFYYYLLYSTRPKNQTKTYSIHVDIYEKQPLNYRGSLWFSINNTFLPVHRFDLTIAIPPVDFNGEHCSKHECIHGKCIKYHDTQQDKIFCQ